MNGPSDTFDGKRFRGLHERALELAQAYELGKTQLDMAFNKGERDSGRSIWPGIIKTATNVAGGLIKGRSGFSYKGPSDFGHKAMSLGESTWKMGFGLD